MEEAVASEPPGELIAERINERIVEQRQTAQSQVAPSQAAPVAKPVKAGRSVDAPKLPEVVRDWIPPKGLRSHDNTSIPNRTFPWGPPPQIGEIVSADSSVRDSGPPSFTRLFLLAGGIAIAIYLVLGEFTVLISPPDRNPLVFRGIALGLGLFCALWFSVAQWPTPPRCTYLGALGAALIEGKWGAGKPSVVQILIFQEATALFVTRIDFYKNLIYERTDFGFDWHRSVDEAPLLHVDGEHTFKDALPDPDHIYHFALRVEEAWSRHLVERLNREIAAGRTLSFPCRKGNFVQMLGGVASPNQILSIGLGSDGIQFVYRNRVEWASFAEFRNLFLGRGVFQVQRDDASWFSPHGKFRIDYQDIGNAQVFLHFLAQVLGSPQR